MHWLTVAVTCFRARLLARSFTVWLRLTVSLPSELPATPLREPQENPAAAPDPLIDEIAALKDPTDRARKIALLRLAIANCDTRQNRVLAAGLRNNLALELQRLAADEGAGAPLPDDHVPPRRPQRDSIDEAIAALQAAIRLIGSLGASSLVATMITNLGNIYYDRQAGLRAANLERTLVCYKAALRIHSAQAYPVRYAALQHNHGVTWRDRVCGDRRQNVERAIAYFRASSEAYARQGDHLNTARALRFLADLYAQRAQGNRAANRELVIEHLASALRILPREDAPEEYAKDVYELALAYMRRLFEAPRDNIEQAIERFHEALTIYTPDANPRECAQTENDLAVAYTRRVAGSRRDNIEDAIVHYLRALDIHPDNDPIWQARVRNNLATAYGMRLSGPPRDNDTRAIACLRPALSLFSAHTRPRDYATIRLNLGAAYSRRGAASRQDDNEDLDRALAYYRDALRVWTRRRFPRDHAQTHNNIAVAYLRRHASKGSREEERNESRSIYHLQRALRALQNTYYRGEYAAALRNLGTIHWSRRSGNRRKNVASAVACLEEAITLFAEQANTLELRDTHTMLATVRFFEAFPVDDAHSPDARTRRTQVELAHQEYEAARRSQAELGWLESNETGRSGVLTTTELVRSLYLRDAWCLLHLGNLPAAMVALEAGRAQALVEAGLIARAPLHGLCDDHAAQFREAQRGLREARQAEERRALRDARDRFLAIRHAIRGHCAPDFLPDEPTYEDILAAPASGQVLVYLAAADHAGFALVLTPGALASQANTQPLSSSSAAPATAGWPPPPVLVPLPELTRDVVDQLLVRRERGDAVTGGLLVAVQQQAIDLLSVWLDEMDDQALREKPITAIVETLPGELATLGQALMALFAGWRLEIVRLQKRLDAVQQGPAVRRTPSDVSQLDDARARAMERVRTLTSALELTASDALHDETLRRELSWWYQRAELDRALPRLSTLIARPLRAALEEHGWGAPSQAVAVVACERLSVTPLHAALVVDAQGVDSPLQETCELTFQASARTLAHARAAADTLPSDGPVLSIGDPSPTRSEPLPHARFEAAGLAALATEAGRRQCQALIGSAATLATTVEQLRLIGTSAPPHANLRGAWVDIASHGHADPTRLQSCFMVLADDEWLTLARLQREQLLEGARCFSASGCVTGLGDILHAPDELGSFAAGAIQAGAAAVLATLWAVSDQANALLMLRVMELVLAHPRERPAWALREAARWLRNASRQDIAQLRVRVRTALTKMASAGFDTDIPERATPAIGTSTPQNQVYAPDSRNIASVIISSDPEVDAAMDEISARMRGVTRAVERIAVEPTTEHVEASSTVRAAVATGSERHRDQLPTRAASDSGVAMSRLLPPYAHPIYWAGVIAYGA